MDKGYIQYSHMRRCFSANRVASLFSRQVPTYIYVGKVSGQVGLPKTKELLH